MKTCFHAWLVGSGLLTAMFGLWFIAVMTGKVPYFLIFVLWLSPAAAAFLVSYFSPLKKTTLGLSMAIVTAVLAVAVNSAAQLVGDAVDLPGIEGAAILFGITLIYSGVGCGIGSLCGYVLAKKSPQTLIMRSAMLFLVCVLVATLAAIIWTRQIKYPDEVRDFEPPANAGESIPMQQ